MNWKLILQLSLFGLAMGLATVFFISSSAEPFFWLAIFIASAYLIATRAPGRYFLHGLRLLRDALRAPGLQARHVR